MFRPVLAQLAFAAAFALAVQAGDPVFDPKPMDPEAGRRALDAADLLPAPVRVATGGATWTPVFDSVGGVELDPSFAAERAALVAVLAEQGHGRGSPQASSASPTRIVVAKAAVAGAPERVAGQAYRMVLAPGGIRIESSGAAGVFNALQTLRQLLPGPGAPMQAMEITDWPRFPLRGFMHDTGRNYQTPELLKKQIDIFSRYKLNVFHFHFTDNPGWRLESKRHPELQAPHTFGRHVGRFYTQEQFRDIVRFARQRHVVVIPELDVPGHTEAFRKAYKLDKMEAPGVKERLLDLIDELCSLAPKEVMPYIHLGTDEVKPVERVPHEWLAECVAAAHRHGRVVVGWNPGIRLGDDARMVQQMWTGGARAWPGRPYLDSQDSYYINHVDPFEMLPAMAYQQPCRWGAEEMKLGAIACVWHDDRARDGSDVILMNAVYPGILLFTDNAWRGRETNGEGLYCRLPEPSSPLFARAVDLERRLLAQRDRYFAAEPFPYVRQTDQRWRFLGPFDNKGDTAAAFPPDTEGLRPGYTVEGKTWTWWAAEAPGATHYPHHYWFPSYLKQDAGTLYAFTRIWSPQDQEVGFWIGFNAWSRSSGRKRGGGTPDAGAWNRSHAALWVNGEAVPGPDWKQPGVGGAASEEIPLVDEDYFYREPSRIRLKAGWNTVLVKAPKAGAWKWVFTCIPVQPTGQGLNAREVPGLRYSADFEGADAEAYRRLLAEAGSAAPAAAAAASDAGGGPAADFDDAHAGPLAELSTPLGLWTAAKGHASIIPVQGKDKDFQLKLEGGAMREVALALPDVETLAGLSLTVQRWTRDAPFVLVVEGLVDGTWRALGTLKDLPMDRATRSLPFAQVPVKGLRFRLDSPAHGGAMLDSLRLLKASPAP